MPRRKIDQPPTQEVRGIRVPHITFTAQETRGVRAPHITLTAHETRAIRVHHNQTTRHFANNTCSSRRYFHFPFSHSFTTTLASFTANSIGLNSLLQDVIVFPDPFWIHTFHGLCALSTFCSQIHQLLVNALFIMCLVGCPLPSTRRGRPPTPALGYFGTKVVSWSTPVSLEL